MKLKMIFPFILYNPAKKCGMIRRYDENLSAVDRLTTGQFPSYLAHSLLISWPFIGKIKENMFEALSPEPPVLHTLWKSFEYEFIV